MLKMLNIITFSGKDRFFLMFITITKVNSFLLILKYAKYFIN